MQKTFHWVNMWAFNIIFSYLYFFSGNAELITKLNKSQLILNAHSVNGCNHNLENNIAFQKYYVCVHLLITISY